MSDIPDWVRPEPEVNLPPPLGVVSGLTSVVSCRASPPLPKSLTHPQRGSVAISPYFTQSLALMAL